MVNLGQIQLDNLKDPIHSKGTFIQYKDILSSVESILELGQQPFQTKISSRIFIDGGTRDDLSEIVTRDPKPVGTNIDDWLMKITDAESFCLALNGVNGLNEKIDYFVRSEFNKHWISQVGMPMGGIDTYCFIGQYPITPFGIHTDQEHTFLYHLGPGQKECWLWYPDDFEKTQSTVKHQFTLEDTEHLAQKLVLEPGDVLFIPAGHYHVLANPEFSVTLGIAPYDRPMRELITDGVKYCLSNKDFVEEIDIDVSLNLMDERSPLLGVLADPEDLWERVHNYIQDESQRLWSCDGMKFAPLDIPVDIKPQSKISLNDRSIKIVDRPGTDQAIVYSEGNVFNLPAHQKPVFESFISTLETNSPMKMVDILTGDEETDDFRLGAVSMMARHRIFQVHHSDD